ncbi:MAG TPA: CFI-box-CTERM domain-containing protein [Bdellovibrionales bacterium]|nr:CFI-box-CTERM domain-containing protein [Bdellovibrionales bacterium]
MPQLRLLNWIGNAPFVLGIAAFAILLTYSKPAYSVITVKVIENGAYSAIKTTATTDTTTGTPTTGTTTVYGGIAGDESDCDTTSATAPCNTCKGALAVCNRRRIHSDLRLQIQVSSDTGTGPAMIAFLASGDTGDADPIEEAEASPTNPSAGQTSTITVTWGELCASISDFGSSTICDVAGTATVSVRVGVDLDNSGGLSDGESKPVKFIIREGPAKILAPACEDADAGDGICYFEVNSGPGSAVLMNLEATSGFPTNGNFAAVRACYKERTTSADTDNPGMWDDIDLDDCHDDLPITSGSPPTVSPKRVGGLENDKIYDFIIGMVDDAGNAGLFTDPDDGTECRNATSVGPDGFNECKTARPSEVVSLLNEKVNCFVATAAYGSPMAKEVGTLRKFRDRFMVPTNLGKAFIRFYYHEGPKLARIISKSEALRTISRAMIYPVLMFATIALQYGGTTALAISLVGAALLVGFIMLARRFSRRLSA